MTGNPKSGQLINCPIDNFCMGAEMSMGKPVAILYLIQMSFKAFSLVISGLVVVFNIVPIRTWAEFNGDYVSPALLHLKS